MAARFLQRRGARVVDRNRRVGRREADLVVEHGGSRVVVEVKTRRLDSAMDPTERIDADKMDSLYELACALGCSRIDAIGVAVTSSRVRVRWHRDIG